MAALIINLLWMLIYCVLLAGVVWLVIYGVNTYIHPLPPKVEGGIWFIILLLVIIGFITVIVGGGVVPHPSMLSR